MDLIPPVVPSSSQWMARNFAGSPLTLIIRYGITSKVSHWVSSLLAAKEGAIDNVATNIEAVINAKNLILYGILFIVNPLPWLFSKRMPYKIKFLALIT